jgi:hypothetical protein
MEARSAPDPDPRDWRLSGELSAPDIRATLRALIDREPDAASPVRPAAKLGEDVVLTHDGRRLFAYAPSRAGIERARKLIEAVLASEHASAELSLRHFSELFDEWVDPDAPLAGPGDGSSVPGAPAARSGPRTITLVATVGRMIREDFEQSMRGWADQLGLRCEIVEHPHLLSSQVAFTVTGPQRKLDEFAAGLAAEERATIRTETQIMASPL